MDTGTHFAIGFGLAGLSQIDPSVTADPWTTTAVMIGVVAGSQAPDFDTLLRFKGNAAYVRNHRGVSHSIPFWLIWTALIGGILWACLPQASIAPVVKWVFAAVLLHVFTDLFNAYGTQALKPFTNRWIAWNIIHIFDPFIFGAHVVAIIIWLSGEAPPAVVFPTLYLLIALYYVLRTVQHARLERKLPLRDSAHRSGDRYTAIPTVNVNAWNIVKRTARGSFVTGEWKDGRLTWYDELICSAHPAVEASKKHPDVCAFLSFSSYACATVDEYDWGYEVRWIDARYRYRKQYPFLAVVRMDRGMRVVDSYVGWISDEKLERRLGTGTG
ncbi:metal-dependent hydrolase [Paenibacillus thermotolerans]|uniref:metal-dependent hydrolase n=1 Tax=Paenibacillus thermotolerans TaxID=3027807 RepID=UPI0023685268|nr:MULTISPECIES: metal-dependent hydrolase [unclassified Paenibacillus]